MTREANPAEVVRAISVANRWDSPSVTAFIAHPEDRPGRLLELLQEMKRPDDSPRGPTGLFAAAAFGAGFVAVTNMGDTPPVQNEDPGGLRSYGFRHNVDFLYDGARPVEGMLVASERRPTLTEAWGHRLRDLSACVAAAAVEAKVPILLLFSPAALPREESELPRSTSAARPPGWRHPAGYALRFSVAMPRTDVAAELVFRRRLVQETSKLRCDLFMRRDDADHLGPGWEPLTAADASKEEPLDGAPYSRERVTLTAVGPAKVGSTSDLLRWFGTRGWGVGSIAVTALDGLAVIHAEVLGASAAANPPASEYPRLVDYQFDWTFSQHGGSRYATNLRPLWIAWQTPRCPGAMQTSLETLYTALGTRLTGDTVPNVEYLVCRETGEDVLRGRAKLTTGADHLTNGAFGPDADDETRRKARQHLGALCSRVERDWRRALRSELKTPWIETEVVWRERWIGRLENFLPRQ
jgi:hypothetical protein